MKVIFTHLCVAVQALHLPLTPSNLKHVYYYSQYAVKFTHEEGKYTYLCVPVYRRYIYPYLYVIKNRTCFITRSMPVTLHTEHANTPICVTLRVLHLPFSTCTVIQNMMC